MRLRDNPASLQAEIFQTTLVHLKVAYIDRAVVVIGGGRFPRRWLKFRRVDGELKLVSFEGPPVSGFLINEARVLALLNMRNQ